MVPPTADPPSGVAPETVRLQVGDRVPSFRLLDQKGDLVSSESLAGAPVLIYFYPKAMTPGCTTQSCLMRDVVPDVSPARVVGISPDPPDRLARFDERHGLGFTLLSDPDHVVAEAFGVWGEKKLYGKTYLGVIRSAFLVDADGTVAAAFPKISPKDTPVRLLAAWKALGA